jgi:hypothetical protein
MSADEPALPAGMFATDEQLARELAQIEAFLLDLQARCAGYARRAAHVRAQLEQTTKPGG